MHVEGIIERLLIALISSYEHAVRIEVVGGIEVGIVIEARRRVDDFAAQVVGDSALRDGAVDEHRAGILIRPRINDLSVDDLSVDILSIDDLGRTDLEQAKGSCDVYTDSSFSFAYIQYGVD
jgi:hypothetical protein